MTDAVESHEEVGTWQHQWDCSSNDDDEETEVVMALIRIGIADESA
jgi:hypothetical protein